RSVFAVSKSNPDVIYLMAANDLGQVESPVFHGGYFTTTGGTTWSPLTGLPAFTSNGLNDQGNYDLLLGVDPKNPDLVYAGAVDLVRTHTGTQGGGTWENITSVYGSSPNSGIHPDQQAIALDPACQQSPCTFYLGNDGGIYRSGSLNVSAAQVTYADL